jgi:hypothetical protein
MRRPRLTEIRTQAEWRLLRALCDARLEQSVRAAVCCELASERFLDVAHRIIFEEIQMVSVPAHPVTAELLREHLPGRVTARGFPDVEFAGLFSSDGSGADDAATKLQEACEKLARLASM